MAAAMATWSCQQSLASWSLEEGGGLAERPSRVSQQSVAGFRTFLFPAGVLRRICREGRDGKLAILSIGGRLRECLKACSALLCKLHRVASTLERLPMSLRKSTACL